MTQEKSTINIIGEGVLKDMMSKRFLSLLPGNVLKKTRLKSLPFIGRKHFLKTRTNYFLPALSLRATRVYLLLCCCSSWGKFAQNTAFLTKFTMLSAYCAIA
jgi:hypothetical protein